MYPAQYLHVKKTMITAVHSRDFFNKRDAQVWFKMDVNKVFIYFFIENFLNLKLDVFIVRLV